MSTSTIAPSPLAALSLDELIETSLSEAQFVAGVRATPRLVVSPYRFNPLGAHIDHQGGSVLARCLDQYTLLFFWPRTQGRCTIHAKVDNGKWQCAAFKAFELENTHGWDAMARAAVTAFSEKYTLSYGLEAVVSGTLISGGLSSSASVVLAYLRALADVNDVELDNKELVELVRRVENDYRGLNNGIQDQMSIVFGQQNHLALLDVENVAATAVPDPETTNQVSFLMCFSGVSRDLVTGSNFNQRVSECSAAASALHPKASRLGDVPEALRSSDALARLPATLQKRATHVYGEMQRVQAGCRAWSKGNWTRFGQLMNESCFSSINHYESGSPWLIDLHEMAGTLSGVYGNRFSGGGYGGCLFLLTDASQTESIASQLMGLYLSKYPELGDKARIALAKSESTVRVRSL